MRAPLRFAAAAAVLAGLLAACALDDPSNSFAQITFEHRPDINLDVGEIQIEVAYLTPGKDPNVDHRFPVPPKDAAVRWAQDRLVARSNRLTFRYIVLEASAVETELPATRGVTGLLTTDQSERYETHIVVEMQVLDGRQVQGTARAEARRSVTVAENIALKDREKVWYRLTEDTMNDLDKQLEETIRNAFFPYIVL
ncbi:MAG: hypothetical protein ACFCUT_19910 [Kiloniellaceae bacterium]